MSRRVNVLYFPGTNCQRETIRAFQHVGAIVRQVFASEVLAGRDRIDDADILCIPGGFCFGDHVRAGLVAGSILRIQMSGQLRACLERPILCICNGFQVAVCAGLFGQHVTLAANESGSFVNRPKQRHFVPPASSTPWLQGLENQMLTFPCAHAEGRFIYSSRGEWRPALYYPEGENPDGSMDNIAGITSPDGLVLGLMNHPERDLKAGMNTELFLNGVRW